MDVRVGLWRKLCAKELMLLTCGVGEDSWESPGLQKIQPVHPKGDQSWVFFGRTDAKAETPIFWPLHAKSWLIGKDSDAWRDWGQEETGTTEDEMAGWHHQLDGHEFEWTPGVGDGQGGLGCCNSWGRKESDTTDPLTWTELTFLFCLYMIFKFTLTLCQYSFNTLSIFRTVDVKFFTRNLNIWVSTRTLWMGYMFLLVFFCCVIFVVIIVSWAFLIL